MMKKLLSMLGIVTLISTSSGTFPTVNNTTINDSNNFALKQKLIRSPKDTLLTVVAKRLDPKREWAYTTINLGQLRQEQIVDFVSTNKNSFTDHKVDKYLYYKNDVNAGINSSNFRNYFYQGQVTTDWTFATAVSKSAYNFVSRFDVAQGSYYADGYIKFQWYYDNNNDLLIDIVAGLYVSVYYDIGGESTASINLGTVFTIIYNE